MYTSYKQGVCKNIMVSSVHLFIIYSLCKFTWWCHQCIHTAVINLTWSSHQCAYALCSQYADWPGGVVNTSTHYAVSMQIDLVASSMSLYIMQSICRLTWWHHQRAFTLCSQYADWPGGIINKPIHYAISMQTDLMASSTQSMKVDTKALGTALPSADSFMASSKKMCAVVVFVWRKPWENIRETFLIW